MSGDSNDVTDAGQPASTVSDALGQRLHVVRGGQPSPAQLAAIVAALRPRAQAATDGSATVLTDVEATPSHDPRGAWGRAAVIEQITGRRIASRDRLVAAEAPAAHR